MSERQRVVIFGGGIAGLTCAYELSRTPALRERFDVQVYQQGWRLGGKLASARVAKESHRSLEHGLHVWFGFYDNAFGLMRELFERWEAPDGSPFRSVEEAFRPVNHAHVGRRVDGEQRWWWAEWPSNKDPVGDGELKLTPWGSVTRMMSLFRLLVKRMLKQAEIPAPEIAHPDNEGSVLGRLWNRLVEDDDDDGWRPGATAMTLLDATVDRAEGMGDSPRNFTVINGLLKLFDRALRGKVAALTKDNVDAHNLMSLLDIGIAFFTGLLKPEYGITRDWDLGRIDHLELREWLIANGGDPDVVNNWSGLRAIYDATFQYEGGDPKRPRFAAGVAARIIIRLVTQYNASVFHHLNAGAGELVVSPLYEVLKQQGVRFHFFHRLAELKSGNGRIASARLDIQARSAKPYAPTKVWQGMVIWPDQPDYEQLIEPSRDADFESHWDATPPVEQLYLRRGIDFDLAVLAVPLGSFQPRSGEANMCADLLDQSTLFREMSEAPPLVPSVGFQMWLNPSTAEAGWADGAPSMVGLGAPLRIWADMSHVLDVEGWREQPGSVHYLCGPVDLDHYMAPRTDASAPARARRDARTRVANQLAEEAPVLWPASFELRDRSPWMSLEGSPFRSVFLKVNVSPHDCIVGSPPVAVRKRLRPDESGFTNLVLCGAWVRNGVDASCVEGAVMSGMQAARTIHEQPRVVVGEDFMQKPWPKPKRRQIRDSELPRYVPRLGHGMQSVLPPGVVLGARLYAFGLDADRDAMQRVVDRNLNISDEVRHTVIGDTALFTVLDGQALTSLVQTMGYLGDREAAFWIPVIQQRRGGLPKLGFFLPYVFVDSSIAMVTGREIWGIWKEMASFRLPYAPTDPAHIRVFPTVFPTLSQRTRGQPLPLVEAYRDGELGELDRAWDDLPATRDWLLRQVLGQGASAGESLENRLEDRAVPLLALKQFRDVREPDRACFQSLVRTTVTINDVRGIGRLGPGWKVKILEAESHPLRADLGLSDDDVMPVKHAAWIDLDFRIDLGREIWKWEG